MFASGTTVRSAILKGGGPLPKVDLPTVALPAAGLLADRLTRIDGLDCWFEYALTNAEAA